MHKVARDREFLTSTLAQTIEVDEFTGRLFKIFEQVWDEGLAQPIDCGMLRSDIMLNTGPCGARVYCRWNQGPNSIH